MASLCICCNPSPSSKDKLAEATLKTPTKCISTVNPFLAII